MEHMAFKHWGPHWRLNIPKGSMVLEYLPTFTLAMAQFCRYTIHGAYGIGELPSFLARLKMKGITIQWDQQ